MKRSMDVMEIDAAAHPSIREKHGGEAVSNGGAVVEEDTTIDLYTLLLRPSPYAVESGSLPLGTFEHGADLVDLLQESAKVLVVGAGGLGCEILKNLSLSGIKDIHVIDLDTIELSNLNRQFLFREKDIGRPKAVVAAEFIMKRIPSVKVTAHHGKIQDKDADFYRSFNVVIAGLDNIGARIWLNSMLYSLAEKDDSGNYDPATLVPLIDGGTEGFSGQARVIIPGYTACFHCTLGLFPPQQTFQLCTIADTPRQPEHCIAYAQLMQWPEHSPDKSLDADNPAHVKWIFERATERAEVYGITGVTYRLTLGVIKNIIPAVASTNAIISAICVNEAIKILTFMSQLLNNYIMYQGPTGVYTNTQAQEAKPDCLVCGKEQITFQVSSTDTLQALIDLLKANGALGLQGPSLTSETQTLYMRKPVSLELATRKNLERPLGDMVSDGEVVNVSDPAVENTFGVMIRFTDT